MSDPPASDLLALVFPLSFPFGRLPRAVINFLMRAASTFEIRNGEQRALRKFSTSWNLSSLKRCYAPSNLADTFKTGQEQAQS